MKVHKFSGGGRDKKHNHVVPYTYQSNTKLIGGPDRKLM